MNNRAMMAVALFFACLLLTASTAYSQEKPVSREVARHIEDLSSRDEKTAINAIKALVKMGSKASPAIPALKELARDPRSKVRVVALYALTELKAPNLVPVFTDAIRDEDDEVRCSGAFGLGQIGPAAAWAVPDLMKLLKSRNSRVKTFATEALGLIGRESKVAIPLIVSDLGRMNKFRLALVAKTLGRIGSDPEMSVPVLVKLLLSEEKIVCNEAMNALKIFKTDAELAVPALIEILKDEKHSCHWRALRLVIDLGAQAEAALPTLRKLKKSKNVSVSHGARSAIARIEWMRSVDLEKLGKDILSEKDDVQVAALEKVKKLGPNAAKVVPILVKLLEKTTAERALKIVYVLKAMGMKAVPASAALVKRLDDEDVVLSGAAYRLLETYGTAAFHAYKAELKFEREERVASIIKLLFFCREKAIPLLASVLYHKSQESHKEALYCLARLRPRSNKALIEFVRSCKDDQRRAGALRYLCRSKDAVSLMLELQTDKSAKIRAIVTGGLGELRVKKAIPGLIKALSDSSEQVALNAAFSMGYFGSSATKEMAEALCVAFKSHTGWMRKNALSSLTKMGTAAKPIVPDLVEALNTKDIALRRSIIVSLGRLGLDESKVVPALVKCLSDSKTRWAAVEALGQFGGRAKSAVPAVVECLKETDVFTLKSAISALERIGDSSQLVLDALKDLENHHRPSIAKRAKRAGKQLRQSAKQKK